MKKCNILFAVLLLAACTKQEVIQKEKCKSVIFWLDIYEAGKLIETDTSIYFPKVCGNELKYYDAMSREPQPICGSGNFLRMVIK